MAGKGKPPYKPSRHPKNYDANQKNAERGNKAAQDCKKQMAAWEDEITPVIATLEKWLELAGDGLKTLKKDGPGFFKRMVDFNTTNETYAENVARIIVLEDEMDRIGDPPNPKDEKKLKQFQAEHEKCDREASKMIDRINALSEELQQHYDTFKEVFEVKPPKL